MELRVLVMLVGWTAGWWLLWRLPRLRATRTDDAAPAERLRAAGATAAPVADVTVIIPARNEAQSLPGLLASLAAQSVTPRQIVVVDDQSTDGTRQVAIAHGVTLVDGAALPEGWTGKTWACAQGAARAEGAVLVFLDADVTLGPDGLARLLDELDRRGGLVSVQPYHRMEQAYERFSAFFNIIGIMGVGAASPGRHGRSRGAFGPVLACHRDDYRAVGGHAAVRGEIVEDVALAREFDRAARPVNVLGGGDVIAFRMYPEGLGQLIEGWSKNMATGAGSVRPARFAVIGLWVTTVLVSVQSLIELVVPGLRSQGIGVLAAVALYALFATQIRVMLRALGNFGLGAALAYPALIGIFVVVFVRSAWLTVVRRQVQWRGRPIPLARSARWAPAIDVMAADGAADVGEVA